jgi:hypothetical protein
VFRNKIEEEAVEEEAVEEVEKKRFPYHPTYFRREVICTCPLQIGF